ncbi:MAG: hypothetical protein ACXWKP_08510 [Bradyrhizobium sp.]|jgi:hypothetical protein
MEKYIHVENLILLRKRLTEPHDDATHKVLLKLLAEEEAKEAILPKDSEEHLSGPAQRTIRINFA